MGKLDKRYISLEGWRPVILHGGEIVLCVVRKARENHQLKVGRVVGSMNAHIDEQPHVQESFYVESLDGKHKWYPYPSDVCVIEEDHNEVSNLVAHLMEVEYL